MNLVGAILGHTEIKKHSGKAGSRPLLAHEIPLDIKTVSQYKVGFHETGIHWRNFFFFSF